MKQVLMILTALLAALGLADYAQWIDGLAAVLPDWLAAFSLLVAGAAPLAAMTPWKWDNKALRVIRRVLNVLGFNVGEATNKEDRPDA